ncbi:type II toxin-antitoxin system RelE/ParE family toxin [Candidatus Thiosymbion oneisti]|uniref:type II toxin-antitoxin system RelE/ParE family toxin n=1 Tax=Candidatus Thiosymbion oneisti TaxID=589554 RepID=UPI003C7BD638
MEPNQANQIRARPQLSMGSLSRPICLTVVIPPVENRLEALVGNRAGQHSIRINNQFRVCFWSGPLAIPPNVEIVDYH